MSKVKPVIKWSGSKRSQLSEILKNIPENFDTYYEPFVGGGSVLYAVKHNKSVAGDICKPLIEFYKEVQQDPDKVIKEYRKRWIKFQKDEDYYYEVREQFNKTGDPNDFLFLTRTCQNGLIRFNKSGKFNNAVHHGRPGINPIEYESIVKDWSEQLKNVKFYCGDYHNVLTTITSNDFIYLDPPYFHTKGMYIGSININDFIEFLRQLNSIGVKWMLSYDGKRGNKDMTVEIPKDVYKRHLYIESGKSSFDRLYNDRDVMVLESLYMNYIR